MTTDAPTTFDRDAMAKWYARRHLEFDPGVDRIYHLPVKAPPREIRFLEVNHEIFAITPLEPIDFGVDIRSAEGHTLNVLDVTPDQFPAIERNELPLPDGWELKGHQILAER